MMSLFSPFDTFFFWISTFTPLIIFIYTFNYVFFKNSLYISIQMMSTTLENFFYTLKPKMFLKISFSVSFSVLMFIFFLNFFSVFPYNFSVTSQFSVVFFLSFSLWLSFLFFNFKNNFKGFSLHFIPEGSPIYLVLLLFLIEVVSTMIRPLTLTVRLVANILAGHLLMILLSKLSMFNLMGFLSYSILNLVELFVSVVQAYIFTTMLILYFSEIH